MLFISDYIMAFLSFVSIVGFSFTMFIDDDSHSTSIAKIVLGTTILISMVVNCYFFAKTIAAIFWGN